MAKSISYNKRENEKKKIAKRLEKQNRKEERKSNKGGSLDDMIAYVDENGMITDTPPEIVKKEEIELESILISTPKKEETDEVDEYRGRVEFFNESKGFGFIKNLANADKYFFHISNAPEDLKEGDQVLFELERGVKGMNAVNIKVEQQ